MTLPLFTAAQQRLPARQLICPGATLLRGFALPAAAALLTHLDTLVRAAPWRTMQTPGGRHMSVQTTNCGAYGWVSDMHGYRYSACDPITHLPWPALPEALVTLAGTAATAAHFPAFAPDACLINRYAPATRMALHQDKDERDNAVPIVSVSLGIAATFLMGGPTRADRVTPVELTHGDVVVFGGPARLYFHGVRPVAASYHPATGAYRINLTLRRAR